MMFLPVINLRQVNYWLPSGTTWRGKLLLLWVWFAISYGWVATATIVAGIGHLYSQRDWAGAGT